MERRGGAAKQRHIPTTDARNKKEMTRQILKKKKKLVEAIYARLHQAREKGHRSV